MKNWDPEKGSGWACIVEIKELLCSGKSKKGREWRVKQKFRQRREVATWGSLSIPQPSYVYFLLPAPQKTSRSRGSEKTSWVGPPPVQSIKETYFVGYFSYLFWVFLVIPSLGFWPWLLVFPLPLLGAVFCPQFDLCGLWSITSPFISLPLTLMGCVLPSAGSQLLLPDHSRAWLHNVLLSPLNILSNRKSMGRWDVLGKACESSSNPD